MKIYWFHKISILLPALLCLQSCGPNAEQKLSLAKADSLYIRVRCVETLSGLIEKTLLLPAQKKLSYKIDYINETYPDTITKAQSEKLLLIKEMSGEYESLVKVTRQLQKRSTIQLAQVAKLNAEIGRGKDENALQFLAFESKCSDTLSGILDTVIKKAVDLGCKSRTF